MRKILGLGQMVSSVKKHGYALKQAKKGDASAASHFNINFVNATFCGYETTLKYTSAPIGSAQVD